MQIIATEEQNGKRLDVVVTAVMPRLSRAFVQKLSESGKILVQGEPKKTGQKVHEGDTITINYDEAELANIPSIEIPIVYEDDDCVVMNKPAGLLTHAPGNLNTEATVASFLRAKVAADDMSGERAGIVHRLDRATSGIIIGAKNSKALSQLQKQFSERNVKKSYIAIVEGHLRQSEAIIDMPIQRNPKAPATFRVGPNGKSARTHYIVQKETEKYSLLELKPETGRTHQLRVHMAQLGHSIIGDPLYGKGNYGDRLYLHALSLEITLPNRERKIFTAPLPPEFAVLMGS